MSQRPNWRMVSKLTDKQLEEAFAYFAGPYEPQIDHDGNIHSTEPHRLVAAQCIALVIENRRAVRQGEEPR